MVTPNYNTMRTTNIRMRMCVRTCVRMCVRECVITYTCSHVHYIMM